MSALARWALCCVWAWQFSPLPQSTVTVKPPTEDYDVVIVGAGTCGASLAVCLGRQGRRVLLVERSMEVPVRCGDGHTGGSHVPRDSRSDFFLCFVCTRRARCVCNDRRSALWVS